MRKNFIIALVLFAGVTVFSSCYYDVEEELYPNSNAAPCDTTNISYLTDVLPVFQRHCYTCHSTSVYRILGDGINLEGYEKVKVYVDNGILINSINHTGSASPMPKDAAILNDCNRAIINRWVLNNAPNN